MYEQCFAAHVQLTVLYTDEEWTCLQTRYLASMMKSLEAWLCDMSVYHDASAAAHAS